MSGLRVCSNCRAGHCDYCCSPVCLHAHMTARPKLVRLFQDGVRITPSHCYVLWLLHENKYTFEPTTKTEARAVRELILKGWVKTAPSVSMNRYALTNIGTIAARLCGFLGQEDA